MKITMVVKVDRLDGALTTFVDVATELRYRGVDVRLFVLATQYVKTLRTAMGTFMPWHDAKIMLWSPSVATGLLAITDGLVVVSANIISHFFDKKCGNSTKIVLYPRLVDDGEWTVQQFRDAVCVNDALVIGNRVNMNILGADYKYVYWQIGLERNRVNVLRRMEKSNVMSLTASDYAGTYHEDCYPTAFTHNVYEYSRLGRLGQGGFENIGKMLFEFLLTGRRVLYSAAGKVMDDGLTEMLALFNVDDNVDQELCIPVVDLEQAFFDKPYDELYALLSRML